MKSHRLPTERSAGRGPTSADIADVRQMDLSLAPCRTKFGGLFFFLPMLATIPLDWPLQDPVSPGSQMITARRAVRSLPSLKLWGRHATVTS